MDRDQRAVVQPIPGFASRRETPRSRERASRLPNCDRADIAPAKVRNYLLSPQQPIGRFKARFFRLLDYEPENWARLAEDLRAAARDGDAQRGESPFGDKFSIVSTIVGPNGRSATIVSVWIVYENGGLEVEFVTAAGRTEALVTLQDSDLRAVDDIDLVSVRPSRRSA
jgi:hypothetical protein